MSIQGGCLVGAAVLTFAMVGCGRDLSFTQDESIDIVAPSSLSTVELPLEIEWTDERPPEPGSDEAYAVFVDRAPVRPGQAVDSVLSEDLRCAADAVECSEVAALEAIGVYVLMDTNLSIADLPDLRTSGRGSEPDRHEVTIVRVDDGHRRGETAFNVSFEVARR